MFNVIVRVYSDDLTEMCLAKCGLCEEVTYYHLLKLHIIREHQDTMESQGRIHFVRKTHHK